MQFNFFKLIVMFLFFCSGRRVQQHGSTSQKNSRGNFQRNNESRNESYHQNYAPTLTKTNDYLGYSNQSQYSAMHYDK